jgi:CubicO group peptidase (beta-lactamase class C family)
MVKPESVGMSSERLSRVRSAMERHIGPDKVPGAIGLVARRGEIVCQECVGLMDRESNAPMREDAIFRIYSMTKPITAVALLMLYEQGHFVLQTPVAKFIPGFRDLQVYAGGAGDDIRLEPLKTPVTIQHLLTHTSGLTYHFLEYGPVEDMYRAAGGLLSDGTLSEFADDVCQLPLALQPGTAFRYSVGLDVCARLVEIISGQPFDRYLRENLFEPMNMVDTGFWVPEGQHQRAATMYGTKPIRDADYRSSVANQLALEGKYRRLAGPHDGLESAPHRVLRGGHGLVSTTHDYYQFCRMLLNKGELGGVRILGRKTWELMARNHLAPELLPYELANINAPGHGFGLSMRVLEDPGVAGLPGSVGEFGWGGAAATYFWIDPAEELIGLVMAQVQQNLIPLSAAFRIAAYAAIVD